MTGRRRCRTLPICSCRPTFSASVIMTIHIKYTRRRGRFQPLNIKSSPSDREMRRGNDCPAPCDPIGGGLTPECQDSRRGRRRRARDHPLGILGVPRVPATSRVDRDRTEVVPGVFRVLDARPLARAAHLGQVLPGLHHLDTDATQLPGSCLSYKIIRIAQFYSEHRPGEALDRVTPGREELHIRSAAE